MSSETTTRRWMRLPRALPVIALVLALVALGSQLSSGFRHQLVLSTTHQPQPYVELYFAQTPPERPTTCARARGTARVSFEVASHLAGRRSLAYEVTVNGATQTGWVAVTPGQAATVTSAFPGVGGDAYELSVRLPELDQQLHARCAARTP